MMQQVAPRRPLGVRVVLGLVAAVGLGVAGCGGDGSTGPGVEQVESAGQATVEYTIPLGAGAALDAGTPLEILPAELELSVGDTVRIVNDDERGHLVGPFFVGSDETVTWSATSPGEFVGECTVHPSGQLVLTVT
jgi:plastocyanin